MESLTTTHARRRLMLGVTESTSWRPLRLQDPLPSVSSMAAFLGAPLSQSSMLSQRQMVQRPTQDTGQVWITPSGESLRVKVV